MDSESLKQHKAQRGYRRGGHFRAKQVDSFAEIRTFT